MAWKRPAIKFVEGENPWNTYFKHKIYDKNGCINAVLTGEPGSGKSWGMLSMALMHDPDLELDGNLFFKAGEMMRAIKNLKSQPGKLWLYDEAGIDLNNLRYQDAINRGLNAFFQTGRHRNYIFIGTVPYLNFVSKGVRKLMNCHFLAKGFNYLNQTIMFPRCIQYNEKKDMFYFKRLIVLKDSQMIPCTELRLPKPKIKIVREYEKLKMEFTNNLYDSVVNEIDKYERKKQAKGIYLTEAQEEALDLLKQGMDLKTAREKLQISDTSMRTRIEAIKKKGFELIPKMDRITRSRTYEIVDPRM